MTQHMVQYTVKPAQAARNEELVKAVFAELDRVQPAGLRCAAFKLDDHVSFVPLISNENTGGQSPLPQLQARKAFHSGMRERCDGAPVRSARSQKSARSADAEVGVSRLAWSPVMR